MPIGSLISAGASLLGGLFNRSAARDANERADRARAEEIALQKEFAQKGIQWRAEDAKAAGIHPLYAIGANTPTYAPVASVFNADTSMGDALSNMGQDVGRAVSATASRNDKMKIALDSLALDRAALENDLLRSQIRRLNVGPALALGDNGFIAGQGDVDRPVALDLPHGSPMGVGKGASAQMLEDEYGEVANLEGAFRYVRDRFWPMIKDEIGSRLSGRMSRSDFSRRFEGR